MHYDVKESTLKDDDPLTARSLSRIIVTLSRLPYQALFWGDCIVFSGSVRVRRIRTDHDTPRRDIEKAAAQGIVMEPTSERQLAVFSIRSHVSARGRVKRWPRSSPMRGNSSY